MVAPGCCELRFFEMSRESVPAAAHDEENSEEYAQPYLPRRAQTPLQWMLTRRHHFAHFFRPARRPCTPSFRCLDRGHSWTSPRKDHRGPSFQPDQDMTVMNFCRLSTYTISVVSPTLGRFGRNDQRDCLQRNTGKHCLLWKLYVLAGSCFRVSSPPEIYTSSDLRQ